ncbi:methyl-cpg-binding domain-containing protein 9 [Phtheirospermum japonicum]|uniref:Methyl-cpg-binding domain-containing protein 9 n=1 Tax=Phtheirospermum japonicum TaxID=374723 RepID=A0A830DIV3_9LAMI|nr:methyl-cpg-binding domain-containing protein 9 [Phtheirospermum japonicum]
MDAEFSKRIGSARMALPIDLNEAPIPSPREAADDAVLGTASVSICTVCRKGVPVGRIPDRVTEEQRREFKCFRCLLKNDGAGSSSGGGGGVGRFDINASPPREAEEGGDVAVVAGRDGNGGSDRFCGEMEKGGGESPHPPSFNFFFIYPSSPRLRRGSGEIQASSSHRATNRQVNPVPEDIRRYLPRASSMATQSANPIFRNLDRGHRANQSAPPFEVPPKSPNMLYLQTLREYIAERSGVLGEGWRVEFEFCNIRFKTSAAYIAPDGIRFKSMEDVASHLGLPSSGSNLFPFTRSGSKADPAKETSGFLTAQSCRKRQKLAGSSEKEHGFSENARRQDGAHNAFPVQFQDFCLISAGNVDPRTSYHNSNQIWPIGYRSSWHDRITGSLFVCDVAEGGICGPIFKIQRYPCTKQPIPVGSTILSKAKPASSKADDKKGDVASLEVVDDDSLSTITLLNEDSPPCLENCLSASKRDGGAHNPQDDNSPNSDLEILPQSNAVGLNDIIGEFQVEGRSTSFAWEMVSQAFLYAFHEAYKQKGAIKFFCGHDVSGMDNESLEIGDPLLRYCYLDSLISFPPLVRNENEFNMASQMLLPWLNQDRFGLDADFVQEILEQLPGAGACSEYKTLNNRKLDSALQTVGSGFLQAERKSSDSGVLKGARINLYGSEGALKRDPCPQGEPLNSRLPPYLIGDSLQVWELAWRFLDVLELGQPFSLRELESELVSPWSDACLFNSRQKSEKAGDACLDTSAGVLYAKIVGSLLKLLVSELLSKAAVYICPGESKSKRGRKKDLDCLAALKRTKLDMLPVNGLTWHEIARRYILAVMCMDGNLDSTEIAISESGRVFHCLHGDGGILCGSLTGIAALEGDAVILADATKEIFGSMKSKNEIITVCERESDDNGAAQTVEVNDGVVPEWAQVLEPVRKLPTNVGARIRRCINEALEKNPPEWAKRILEHSISKEVYKGNASGPTKRAVISVLGNLGNENPEQKVEKKEKVKIKTNVFDLVTKQCRVVLRQAAALDEDKVFCNLLARIILIPNDNDDVGVLGYPAMVSRPLDFRTIDLRLAAGAYGGSHEAFADDVREVWRNIRTAYGDRSDLIDAAENLSKKFEDLYENEVLTLIQKITEISNVNESSAEAIKERDDLLVHVCNSSLPRAPWEEGICKVCGMDKDDDNVLLCDKCDSEYHRYCLNPPLLKIPEGNWYCPSCVTGQSITSSSAYFGSIANRNRKKKNHGEFTAKFLEELARLAKLMEIKEYWEFTVEERTFFMKFLFDDALNSATVRDHMEQSASRAADLQQKLRSLTSELKLLKFKEEMFNSTAVEKSKPDASPSLLAIESISRGKQPDKGSGSNLLPLDAPSLSEQTDNNNNKQPNWPPLSSQQHENNVLVQCQLARAQNEQRGSFLAPPSPKDNNTLKADMIKNDISNLQGSIASIESELLKVSLRKDYLGRDSNGRVYWAFCCPGARPWIIACGDNSSKERCVEEFASVPDSEKWMYYESDDEIDKLIEWLRDDNLREKELRESISQLQSNKLKDVEYTVNHILNKVALSHNGQKDSSTDYYSATKAMNALKKQLGLFSNMRRCECLELLWASKEHCSSCHHSFPNVEDLRQHAKENCKPEGPVSKKIQAVEDNNNVSKRKKSKNVAPQVSTSEKQNDSGPSFAERCYADCPFNLEEIMTRFVVPGSVKDAVNEIGLMGSGGVPTFLLSESTYLSDPALKLDPTRVNEASSTETPPDSRSDEPRVVVSTKENKESSRLSRFAETGEGSNVERSKSGPAKEKCTVIQLSKSSIICESSLRPLVGRASEILRSIKINLLDMDAALPEDALRMSRSNQEKRCVWRDFVKSAKSIYEMVQATIVLEDAIKSEHLRNDWWYWSSYSTAAKITTLSALALRVYSLDAAISYDKPLPSIATEVTEPNSAVDEEVAPQGTTSKNPENPSSPTLQKTPEPESAENPRTRSRSSKRKKI